MDDETRTYSDYRTWRLSVLHALQESDLFWLLHKAYKRPSSAQISDKIELARLQAKWDMLNSAAKNIIIEHCNSEMLLQHITQCPAVHDMWLAIDKRFGKTTRAQDLALDLTELNNLQKPDVSSLEQFCRQFEIYSFGLKSTLQTQLMLGLLLLQKLDAFDDPVLDGLRLSLALIRCASDVPDIHDVLQQMLQGRALRQYLEDKNSSENALHNESVEQDSGLEMSVPDEGQEVESHTTAAIDDTNLRSRKMSQPELAIAEPLTTIAGCDQIQTDGFRGAKYRIGENIQTYGITESTKSKAIQEPSTNHAELLHFDWTRLREITGAAAAAMGLVQSEARDNNTEGQETHNVGIDAPQHEESYISLDGDSSGFRKAIPVYTSNSCRSEYSDAIPDPIKDTYAQDCLQRSNSRNAQYYASPMATPWKHKDGNTSTLPQRSMLSEPIISSTTSYPDNRSLPRPRFHNPVWINPNSMYARKNRFF